MSRAMAKNSPRGSRVTFHAVAAGTMVPVSDEREDAARIEAGHRARMDLIARGESGAAGGYSETDVYAVLDAQTRIPDGLTTLTVGAAWAPGEPDAEDYFPPD